MYSTVVSASICGIESRKVTVEADVSDGLPAFNLVGFLASETREAAERVRTALRNSGVRLSPQHVTVNLAPASFHKDGSLFDLAIAIALMGGYGFFPQQSLECVLLLGELNLNGGIGPVKGVLEIVSHAEEYGCSTVIVPQENLAEGSVIKNVTVLGAGNLNQVIHYLAGRTDCSVYPLEDSSYEPPLIDPGPLLSMEIDTGALRAQQLGKGPDFSLIRGQALMRRAAEIAVSGFHNLRMIGPPGAGKSLTARCIASILPETTMEEALEITKIHSIAGTLPKETGLLTTRPYRAPHHTITPAALCGGGSPPGPGEISLAHRGVLYLDEMPEFKRGSLEILRQPLEDREIVIARNAGTFHFPANFLLMAAMNPCPCGYYPDLNRCRCSHRDIQLYMNRISQPLLDRIDLCVECSPVTYEELTGAAEAGESSAEIREKVMRAHEIQQARFAGTGIHFNSEIPSAKLSEFCPCDEGAEKVMMDAFSSMRLSARGYHRIIKVARTIADLDGAQVIRREHAAEAVCYRMIDRKYWTR